MRRTPPSLLATLTGVLALSQLASQCPTPPPPPPGDAGIEITLPVDTLVSECLPEIRFELEGEFKPWSVQASLNGHALDPIAVGGGVYTAATDRHLAASNLLEVSAHPAHAPAPISESFAFDMQPPVRARRISDEADLITGPLAHSRIGDWLLRNCTARFIIQDAPQRDLYSVGAFGGNLIDLELIGREGLDNFIEIAPTLDVETVVNPQTVEVVNDGTNGEPASIRSCGPDDLLDFINPSSQLAGIPGVMIPGHADDRDLRIEACTLFSLEPFTSRIRMDTTVTNNGIIGLPLLVGDWINPGGELENLFTPGLGPGSGLTDDLGAISWVGYGEAAGVDYSYTTEPFENESGLVASFLNTSGVTLVLHTIGALQALLGVNSPFQLLPGESDTYTRYLAVGDGSASNSVDLVNDVRERPAGRVEGCVTVGGEPAAGARVAIGTLDGGEIADVHTLFTTDEHGCYAGTVPATPAADEYAMAAALIGHLYEGGGLDPQLNVFTIATGETLVLPTVDLPVAGGLLVQVTDGAFAQTSARVTIVGFDPSPEPILSGGSLFGLNIGDLGLFRDPGDSHPFGLVTARYTEPPFGKVSFPIEPGTYELYVSRGPEYSLFQQTVTVVPGVTQYVQARIDRVVDTTGFISSDFHVHGIRSADSQVSDTNRVLQFAGEGVDNVIMTDHGVHTDLGPRIAELGLQQTLHATIGEEITTFDYGHFNGYPFTIDPTKASGGSTDWGQPAPAGMDFPQYGALNATPAEIYALASAGPRATANTAVQINHIGSHFSPLKIDTGIAPFHDGLSVPERQALRLPTSGNLFHVFDALELWNGESRGSQETFLDERMGIWFNHLNQGIPITFIADTDTHKFFNLNTAGARTWTPSSTDAPELIDPQEIGHAVLTGRAVGGQGAYVQTRLHAGDGSGESADLSLDGVTMVATSNGAVNLEIDVQAPLWAEYDRIEIYANATTLPDGPFQYGGIPTVVLSKDVDFTVDTVAVNAFASRLETRGLVVPFEGLTEDTWFVVVVKGSDGVSQPMFPVFPENLSQASNTALGDLTDGNLGEGGVMALGATNALYADVDGTPGFQLGL